MSWSLSRDICGLLFFVQHSGQVLAMLTTPTSTLYMESFGDAAKGKVKAAEREAEKKKRRRRGTVRKNRRLQKRRSPPAATPTASRPRRPSDAAPQRACALARLQQRACAPLLRAGPLGRLQQRACARQQRACARSLRAARATGLRACLGGTQGGAHFGGLRWVQRCQWLKFVAWPRAGFANRARLHMVLGFQHGQQQCQ